MRHVFVFCLLWLCSATAMANQPVNKIIAVLMDGGNDFEKEQLPLFQKAIQDKNDQRKFNLLFPKSYTRSGNNTLAVAEKQLYALLADKNVSMILTLGPISAKAASNIGKTKRGLFKPVLAPIIFDAQLQNIGTKSYENRSNIRNFHFIDVPNAIENDIAAFKEVLKFEYLGVVVDKGVAETMMTSASTVIREKFEKRLPNIRKIGVFVVGANGKEPLARMGALPESSQGVYLTGFYQMSADNRQIFIKGLNKLKKPTFTKQGRDYVKAGVLASLLPETFNQMRAMMTAMVVQKALSGQNIGLLPVHLNAAGAMAVNMATARDLGISPTWDVLAEAEQINGRGGYGYLANDLLKGAKSLDEMGYTIGEAIDSVMKNPQYRAAEQQVKVDLQEFVEARAAYLPTLEAALDGKIIDADRAAQSMQYFPENNVKLGLSFSQNIWSYEKIATIKMAQTRRLARAQDLEAIKLQLQDDAGRAYLALLHARSIEKSLRDRISRIRNFLDLSRRRAKRDETAQADVYRMQTVFSKARRELLQAQSTSRHLEILFNQVIGQPISQTISLEDQDLITAGLKKYENQLMSYVKDPRSFPAFSQVMVDLAMKRNPGIKSMSLNQKAFRQQQKGNLSRFFAPEISAYAGFDYHLMRTNSGYFSDVGDYNRLLNTLQNEPKLNEASTFSYNDYTIDFPKQRDMVEWELGVRLSLPLLNGFKNYGSYQTGKAELAKLSHKKEAKSRQIESELRGHLVDLNTSYQGINLAVSGRKTAAKGLKLTAENYEAGKRPLIDLNDASEDFMDAELDHIQALYVFRRHFLSVLSKMSALDFYVDSKSNDPSKNSRKKIFDTLNTNFQDGGFYNPSKK